MEVDKRDLSIGLGRHTQIDRFRVLDHAKVKVLSSHGVLVFRNSHSSRGNLGLST
jgi:hypothetical protein